MSPPPSPSPPVEATLPPAQPPPDSIPQSDSDSTSQPIDPTPQPETEPAHDDAQQPAQEMPAGSRDDGPSRALSVRTAPSVNAPGQQSLKKTISRAASHAASHLQAAHGIKEPWGLKWRSSSWFITAVVAVGVCSDILAYTIVVPILPYRLEALGYDNIAALTSWLLFAYSAGIFVGTFPTAWFFHRYPLRRGPLVAAVLIMIGSCILFMLPNNYTAMVISRVIQGLSSCIVWTVGFALICENIDPAHLGTHLGFAFTGLSVGATIAPPIGGALYKHMGWHAPFIFLIIILSIDTVARLFIVEQKDIQKLRARQARHAAQLELEASGRPMERLEDVDPDAPAHTSGELPRNQTGQTDATCTPDSPTDKPKLFEKDPDLVELSPWGVLRALVSLPRGVVAFFLFFVFGFIVGAYDASLTIRVETIWHKDADFVGLIYLAGAAPSFFTGPLAGWMSDKYGTEWVMGGILFLCLPWIPLMTLTSSLPGFVVYFAITNVVVTMINSVASLEVAIVSKFRPGISEIHEFAAMNLAFAVSSAVGAVVGGQIYNNVPNGWNVICWICFACFILMIPPALLWTGGWPLFWRAIRRPGPRSGRHPDELAKEDAEKAAREVETAGLTTRKDSDTSAGEALRHDDIELMGMSSDGHGAGVGDADGPPTLPPVRLATPMQSVSKLI